MAAAVRWGIVPAGLTEFLEEFLRSAHNTAHMFGIHSTVKTALIQNESAVVSHKHITLPHYVKCLLISEIQPVTSLLCIISLRYHTSVLAVSKPDIFCNWVEQNICVSQTVSPCLSMKRDQTRSLAQAVGLHGFRGLPSLAQRAKSTGSACLSCVATESRENIKLLRNIVIQHTWILCWRACHWMEIQVARNQNLTRILRPNFIQTYQSKNMRRNAIIHSILPSAEPRITYLLSFIFIF